MGKIKPAGMAALCGFFIICSPAFASDKFAPAQDIPTVEDAIKLRFIQTFEPHYPTESARGYLYNSIKKRPGFGIDNINLQEGNSFFWIPGVTATILTLIAGPTLSAAGPYIALSPILIASIPYFIQNSGDPRFRPLRGEQDMYIWVQKNPLRRAYFDQIKVASGNAHLPNENQAQNIIASDSMNLIAGDPKPLYEKYLYATPVDLSDYDPSVNYEAQYFAVQKRNVEYQGLSIMTLAAPFLFHHSGAGIAFASLGLGIYLSKIGMDYNPRYRGQSNLDYYKEVKYRENWPRFVGLFPDRKALESVQKNRPTPDPIMIPEIHQIPNEILIGNKKDSAKIYYSEHTFDFFSDRNTTLNMQDISDLTDIADRMGKGSAYFSHFQTEPTNFQCTPLKDKAQILCRNSIPISEGTKYVLKTRFSLTWIRYKREYTGGGGEFGGLAAGLHMLLALIGEVVSPTIEVKLQVVSETRLFSRHQDSVYTSEQEFNDDNIFHYPKEGLPISEQLRIYWALIEKLTRATAYNMKDITIKSIAKN